MKYRVHSSRGVDEVEDVAGWLLGHPECVLFRVEPVLLSTKDVARLAGCSRTLVIKCKGLGLIAPVMSDDVGDKWDDTAVEVLKSRVAEWGA